MNLKENLVPFKKDEKIISYMQKIMFFLRFPPTHYFKEQIK